MIKTNAPERGLAPYRGPRQRQCSICGEKYYALNLCNKHFIRLKRHGSPLICIHNADRKNVRLSPEKVIEIRKLRESGLTIKSIADSYEVHRTTIGKACAGINWKDVA